MLSLEVRAYMSELLENTYTRSEIENLANKFGVVAYGRNKLLLAKDFLSRLPEGREKELIEKTVSDAMKRAEWNESLIENLEELARILESTMFYRIDERGKIVPIVEPSIKPDVGKERGFLERQMEGFGFDLALSHFRQALDTYKISYPGSIALFRNSMQALIEEIIKQRGENLLPVFTDNIRKLVKMGVLKKLKREEEFRAVESLFKMLSHYGSHSEHVTEEVANLLYVWTITTLSFLLKRYQKLS